MTPNLDSIAQKTQNRNLKKLQKQISKINSNISTNNFLFFLKTHPRSTRNAVFRDTLKIPIRGLMTIAFAIIASIRIVLRNWQRQFNILINLRRVLRVYFVLIVRSHRAGKIFKEGRIEQTVEDFKKSATNH